MTTTLSNTINFTIVAAGCALTFVSAFTAQYALGYYLDFEVVMIGLLPYLVFAVAAARLQGVLTTIHGVVLLAVHAWMVITIRLLTSGGSDEPLLYGPLILSVVLIPLLIMAVRTSYDE